MAYHCKFCDVCRQNADQFRALLQITMGPAREKITSAYPTVLSLIRLYVFAIGLVLTHWGRVTHIYVSKLTIIGSDNGLSPSRRQAIIWTNAGLLLIQPSGKNFSEILVEIDVFSFKKMHLKMSSAKCHRSMQAWLK